MMFKTMVFAAALAAAGLAQAVQLEPEIVAPAATAPAAAAPQANRPPPLELVLDFGQPRPANAIMITPNANMAPEKLNAVAVTMARLAVVNACATGEDTRHLNRLAHSSATRRGLHFERLPVRDMRHHQRGECLRVDRMTFDAAARNAVWARVRYVSDSSGEFAQRSYLWQLESAEWRLVERRR